MAGIERPRPFAIGHQEAMAFWLVDILWVVLATDNQTGGKYSVVEQWMPEGSGPPPHVRAFEDEAFFVMEGEMTLEVGGETLVAGPRSLANLPRNTVHSFKVTKGPAHVLNDSTPAGFEQTTMGCARPAESRTLPSPCLDPPDSPQVVRFFNNDWIATAELPLGKAGRRSGRIAFAVLNAGRSFRQTRPNED
jgi:quercetin dioxygenase-like cupin family protein